LEKGIEQASLTIARKLLAEERPMEKIMQNIGVSCEWVRGLMN
jgi:hypothetical protein